MLSISFVLLHNILTTQGLHPVYDHDNLKLQVFIINIEQAEMNVTVGYAPTHFIYCALGQQILLEFRSVFNNHFL